jgi:hypothetical protein
MTPEAHSRFISMLDRAAIHGAGSAASRGLATAAERFERFDAPALREAMLGAAPGRWGGLRSAEQARALAALAQRLEGTRDLAGAAEALLGFPFVWLPASAREAAEVPKFMALTPEEFLGLEALTSYEFVHYIAWMTGERPVRLAPSEDGAWIDLVAWNMAPHALAREPARWTGGTIPRGALVMGVSAVGADSPAGYALAALSTGDGRVIALSAEGLRHQPVAEAFPTYLYESIRVGTYGWEGQPRARPREALIREALQDVAWASRP